MRLNQVSISISRFGNAVPKDYPADRQHINVYSDSSESVFEALSMAYCQAVNAIREYQPVAARTDVNVNVENRLQRKPTKTRRRRYENIWALDAKENGLM